MGLGGARECTCSSGVSFFQRLIPIYSQVIIHSIQPIANIKLQLVSPSLLLLLSVGMLPYSVRLALFTFFALRRVPLEFPINLRLDSPIEMPLRLGFGLLWLRVAAIVVFLF